MAFARASLAHQFLLISFPVLLSGMLIIGILVGSQVEESVVHRMGGVTGLYVDSMIAPHVQSLRRGDTLDETDRNALEALLTKTALGQRIVSFKIWRADGTILYSADPDFIGRTFPIGEGLAEALSGDVHSEISGLTAAENVVEASKWTRLVETYAPVHALGEGHVIAAAEFYQPVAEVFRESFLAQCKSWVVVASVTALMYLALFTLVRRGSHTIEQQRRHLNETIAQLTRLNAQNERLHERIRRAAASNTAANESLLRRISADLHDGPGQDLSFALMRFDEVRRYFKKNRCDHPAHAIAPVELNLINTAMASALKDMRAICAGLRLPALDLMSIRQIAVRAIEDFQGKTGVTVELTMDNIDSIVPLPVRIAFYRLLQEGLSNGFRHAAGMQQRIDVSLLDNHVYVQIIDQGPGFDSAAAVHRQGHGLSNMRDRVEVLGGSFAVLTAKGKGTTIKVSLPLAIPEVEYG
jgi:signal transduction histidine kinase